MKDNTGAGCAAAGKDLDRIVNAPIFFERNRVYRN